jgi:hypothetical protein
MYNTLSKMCDLVLEMQTIVTQVSIEAASLGKLEIFIAF